MSRKKSIQSMVCECGGSLKSYIGRYHYAESGLDNIYLDDVQIKECGQCGRSTAAIPRVLELHATVARAIVTQESPLSGADAKFLRKSLFIKSIDWAPLLGVDPATITRWERGDQPIGVQSDKMIRLLYVRLFEERQQEFFRDRIAEKPAEKHERKVTAVAVSVNSIGEFQRVAIAA